MRQRERRAQFEQVPLAWPYPSRRHERVEPFPRRYGNEESDGASAIGYFERLPGSDALEPTAGLLAKLANSNLFHVLRGSISARLAQHRGLRSTKNGRHRQTRGPRPGR